MIDIVCILDESGSMGSLQDQVISSFNEFVEEQQKEENSEALLTLVKFDTMVTTLFKRVPIQAVKPIGEKEYSPSGMTALYDAIGSVLHDPLFFRSRKGILVIHTDGFENSSKEYDKESVRKLIEAKSDWEIIFFGADLNSVEEAKDMGIKLSSTYENTKDGFKTMYSSVTRSVSSYVKSNK